MKELCLRALDVARGKGAVYADARIVRSRRQDVSTEDERVSGVGDSESAGIGVRVLCDGAWGFAATARLDRAEVERVAAQAVEISLGRPGAGPRRNPLGGGTDARGRLPHAD